MLRRKLILILGCVTALLVIMAVVALWPLQRIFQDLDHISTYATDITQRASDLNRYVSSIEVELYRLQTNRTHRLDDLINQMQQLHVTAEQIGRHYLMQQPGIDEIYQRMMGRMAVFERHASALATTSDPYLAARHNIEALSAAAELRGDAMQISQHASAHLQAEQSAVTSRFRWLVVGIAIGFLLVINISIMMMLRAAGMILRPVDKLVDASRQLAMERFDYRVEVGQKDEFDELGRAYNRLAEQLQHNEQRRVEVLGQVALTLNHELNNAMAVIELQLKLLSRQAPQGDAAEACLKQIHSSLQRMAKVVESLKHIRRIVLTDYTQGVKMLDLERSLAGELETGEPDDASVSTSS